MKRNKKLKKLAATLSLCLIASVSTVDAHSGRTDSSGGHRDNKNKSGLGSYHYHCGGHPAHLHTNGCPYTGVGTNSSSGGGTTTVQNSEEQQKQSVKKKGYDTGYNDGYSGKLSDTYYSGDYSELYEEKYNEGYQKGINQLEEEKKIANQKGYELGKAGSQIQGNTYSNEKLQDAYENGYEDGISEYRAEKIKYYSNLGLSDGKVNVVNKDIENIDEEFKQIYEDNYSKGQEILSKEYIDKGYSDGFKDQQYKAPNYKHDKFNKWYKKGFDKALEDIENVKETGYNDGYEGNEQLVPKNLEHAKEIYEKAYEDGKAVADEEFKQNTTTVASIGVVGWLIRRYLVARKSIM